VSVVSLHDNGRNSDFLDDPVALVLLGDALESRTTWSSCGFTKNRVGKARTASYSAWVNRTSSKHFSFAHSQIHSPSGGRGSKASFSSLTRSLTSR